jgi:hypothetical protein
MTSYESLKFHRIFIHLNLKESAWSSPGGHLNSFKNASESVIIRYYTNYTLPSFQGDEGKKFMNILVKKITSNELTTVQDDKIEASICDLTA